MKRFGKYRSLFAPIVLFVGFVITARAQNTFPNPGNVGIGTANPTTLLNVVGSGTGQTGQIRVDNGVVQTQIASDVTQSFGQVGTTSNHALNIVTNNSSRMFFTNTGNVGIGTTNPGAPLELRTFGGNGLYINGAQDNNAYSIRMQSTSWPSLNIWDFRIRDQVEGDFQIYDGANNVARLYIKNDGKVGIGTTTPNYKLDVNGEINATGLRINGTPVSGGGGSSQWSGTGPIYYNSGSVGIGTASPSSKLVVVSGSGYAYFLNNSTGVGDLFGFQGLNGRNFGVNVYAPNATNLITHLGINYAVNGANGFTPYTIIGGKKSPFIELNAEDGSVSLFGENGAGADWRSPALNLGLSVRGNGNVGMGTITPNYKLDVNGEINGTGLRINGVPISSGGGSSQWTGTNPGPISYTGGNVGVGGTVRATGNDTGGAFSSGAGLELRYVTVNGQSSILSYDRSASTYKPLNFDASSFNFTTGNVGIGIAPGSQYKLDVAGNINSSATITGSNIVARYQDVAEWVPSSEQLSAGTVVVLDATKSNQVISSSVSYDTRVAGVISEQPGIALGEKSDNKVLVATTGRVRIRVDASRAPIRIGDLLVTSDIPGVAMKSEPIEIGGRKMHMPGTLIGKALEPLEKGSGEILVLLSLQ